MNFLKIKEIDKFELDSVNRTISHGKIIQEKKILKLLYQDWYINLMNFANYNNNGVFLELGSGGGFIKDFMPNIITSDVFEVPGVDKVIFAENIPFNNESIDSILMIDVFHHIPNVRLFLNEANRVLKPGGTIVMSEPWNSTWGKFIYQNFHHEPFLPEAEWELKGNGPLSSANGALPWILFKRDRIKFENEYPKFKIEKIIYHTPFRYLLSGGVSFRQIIPSFTFKVLSKIEKMISSEKLSMFAFIVIRKI